jgi:hypothetical protein
MGDCAQQTKNDATPTNTAREVLGSKRRMFSSAKAGHSSQLSRDRLALNFSDADMAAAEWEMASIQQLCKQAVGSFGNM